MCGRLRRGKVRVYIRRSQAPHRQGQKLDENEKGMYGLPEVNGRKCWSLRPACIHNGQDFSWSLGGSPWLWRRLVRRARRKLSEPCGGGM